MPSGQLTDYQKLSALPFMIPFPHTCHSQTFFWIQHLITVHIRFYMVVNHFQHITERGISAETLTPVTGTFFILTGQQLILLFHQHFVG